MENNIIRTARESDRDAVLGTLLLAFSTDPMMRWLFPNAASYVKYYRAFADAFGGISIENGSCHIYGDMQGVAMWLAPGVESDAGTMIDLAVEALSPELAAQSGEFMMKMAEYHPADEDCWYLNTIGVDPSQQNKGVGAALINEMTNKLDGDGCMAYLESSNPQNVSLYLRHGFEVVGQIQLGDSPIMTAMARARR